MCGITDLDGLMTVIQNKSPVFSGTIYTDDLLFLYVKNYCKWSKKACHRIINKKMKNVKIVDVINKAFVAPSNIELPTCLHIPDKIADDISTRFTDSSSETVPQIFIYKDDKWYYIGGCDTFETVSIQQSVPKMLTNGRNNYIGNQIVFLKL